MNTILNSPVVLALLTMFCFALSTPLIRAGYSAGATAAAFCVGYGVPLVIFAVFEKPGNVPVFGSGRGVAIAFVAGILMAGAVRLSLRAYALPSGHTSIVAAIIGAFPVLAVFISIFFFGEAHKVRIPAVAVGSVLTTAGVVVTALYGMKP